MALFLTGLFFSLGFGVSYYILLRWFLEMDTAARPSVTRQFSIVDLEEHHVSQGEHDRAEAGRGLKSGTKEVRRAG